MPDKKMQQAIAKAACLAASGSPAVQSQMIFKAETRIR
jgi:hypothetical protein